VPVVLGAHKEDYLAAAPPNSFIHVEDFSSVQDLAEHLQMLSENDEEYNKYFQWKGTGSFVNTKFWCRLCMMLHTVPTEGKVTWYESVNNWWNEKGSCTKGRWDDPDALIDKFQHE
jgi:glycoprotein 3-alpha-L-fucosyltransferase